MFVLELSKGSKILLRKDLEGGETLSLGRSSKCDIVIEDAEAGRNHAEIYAKGKHYFVRDLGSVNGTRVNGLPVKKKRLKKGDRVRVGEHLLVLNEVKDKVTKEVQPGFRVLNGNERGTIYPVNPGKNLVGRGDEAEIRFSESMVSTEHAMVTRDEKDIVYVRDLGSRNGTKVNDKPCGDGKVVKAGDIVRFGHARCRYYDDISTVSFKLSPIQLATVLFIVFVAVAAVYKISEKPDVKGTVTESRALMAEGRYGAAMNLLEEAAQAYGKGDGRRLQLDGLLNEVQDLVDADSYYEEFTGALSNKRWNSVHDLAGKLKGIDGALHPDPAVADKRKQEAEQWYRLADAYLNAGRLLGRSEPVAAKSAFTAAGSTNGWPEDFVNLFREVHRESDARQLCDRVEAMLREGQARQATELLGQVSPDAAMSRDRKRELEGAASQLQSIARARENVLRFAKQGEFGMVEAIVFPNLAERNDLVVIAYDQLKKDFTLARNNSLAFASRYERSQKSLRNWRNTSLPPAEKLFERWDRAEGWANQARELASSSESLLRDLTANPRWRPIAGGRLEAQLKQDVEFVRSRKQTAEAASRTAAKTAAAGGDARGCAMNLRLLVTMNPTERDLPFEKGAGTAGAKLRECEEQVSKLADKSFNEGYMLQYGSAARIAKMQEVVAKGLPWQRSVRAAQKELEQIQK